MGEPGRLVQFGTFEVDLDAAELRKHGLKIRLPEQAFQVLAMLLEQPGDVVKRSDLRARLWPGRTHMDFEHGLNKAVNRLRQALGDSAGNPRFVATVARRGYRFLAPVRAVAAASPTAAAPRIHLAVLPFANLSADAEQEFFSDGLTEEMIAELGRLNPGRLGIIARTSAMHYKRCGKRIDEIGRELNVEYILEGSVRKLENRARITTQLVQVSDQAHLWSCVYDREVGDIFQVQSDVARSVAEALACELLPEAHAPAVPAEAYEAYLQGRFFWNKGNSEDAWRAIECYRKALEHYPRYAMAYSGMANCYGRLVWFCSATPLDAGARAKAAAEQALKLDSRLAESHASMALVRFWYDWNWEEAEKEFRHATELRPNYADAHNWYAAYLNVMGRFEEASAEQRIAEELDPQSLTIAMNAADPYYFGRRYERAIEIFQSVLSREPRFFPAHYNIGRAYIQMGRYEDAAEEFAEAARLSGNRQAAHVLAYALGRAGRTSEARTILDEMAALTATQYVPAPQLALIHLGLNEPDRAIDLLERGLAERSYWMLYLRADPIYDGIRSHPRFARILSSMNLPVHAAAAPRL